jgi:hypothetical protein
MNNALAVEIIKTYTANVKSAEPTLTQDAVDAIVAAQFAFYLAHAADPGKYAYHPHPYNEAETILHHAHAYLLSAASAVEAGARREPAKFSTCQIGRYTGPIAPDNLRARFIADGIQINSERQAQFTNGGNGVNFCVTFADNRYALFADRVDRDGYRFYALVTAAKLLPDHVYAYRAVAV